jgi:hypothetical protein
LGSVRLNGQPFTIVGVAPEKYQGLLRACGVGGSGDDDGSTDTRPAEPDHSWQSRHVRDGALKPASRLRRRGRIQQHCGAALPRISAGMENIRRQGRSISILPESESRVMREARLPLMIFAALLLSVVGSCC